MITNTANLKFQKIDPYDFILPVFLQFRIVRIAFFLNILFPESGHQMTIITAIIQTNLKSLSLIFCHIPISDGLYSDGFLQFLSNVSQWNSKILPSYSTRNRNFPYSKKPLYGVNINRICVFYFWA